MLPQYNRTIEITTPTRNTYIYIARKRKRKDNKLIRAFKRDTFACGIGLLTIGIIAIAFFAHLQEDATGAFMVAIMGIACLVADYRGY